MSGTKRLLIAALLVTVSGSVSAEQNDAKTRYLSGQSHYNLNEFTEALQDFKEAYRLRPDPAFLFNIAQCERQLGDLEEAIKFYRSYLRNKPDAPNKREVEKKIDEMKGLIEAKKKATTGAPQSVIPPLDDGGTRAPDRSRSSEPPPVVLTPPSPPPAGPIYKKWWFWAGVGALAVGAGVLTAVALSGGAASPPSSALGNQRVF